MDTYHVENDSFAANSTILAPSAISQQNNWQSYFVIDVLSMMVSIFGILGNTLSFIVLHKCRPQSSYIFILQTLAIADSTTVACAFIKSLIWAYQDHTNFEIVDYSVIFYLRKFVLQLENWGAILSNWFLVQLSLDRFIYVSKPFSASLWCSVGRTKKVSVGIFISSIVLFVIPSIMILFVKYKYKIVIYAAAISMIYLLPIFILLTVNTKLMCTVRKAARYHGSLTNERTLQRRSLIVNLVVIVLIFLVCAVCRLAYLIYKDFFYSGSSEDFTMTVLDKSSDMLLVSSHATNVLVYFFFYRRFRVLLKTICFSENAEDF